jgi:hypothetical protein
MKGKKSMAKGYVDSDGHVMENERELNEFIEAPFNNLVGDRFLVEVYVGSSSSLSKIAPGRIKGKGDRQ